MELEPLANALKRGGTATAGDHADETPVTIMRMGDDEKTEERLCLGLCQHSTIQFKR